MNRRRLYELLRPSPTIPRLPWSAASPATWLPAPWTLATLLLGLVLFGIGEASLVNAALGTTPWTVLAQGIARHTPLDVGESTISVSVVVLLGWIPLRQRPGLGTVLNIVVIGLMLDAAIRFLPHPHAVGWQLLQVAGGIAAIGVGSAFYLTANLGPGPRDGWMTGIHRVTGLGIASVRTALEVSALVAGGLLGGHVGVGTFAFALLVGYALAATLRVLVALTGSERARARPDRLRAASSPPHEGRARSDTRGRRSSPRRTSRGR
jgi:uncharacterized membrane protein YczE